MQNLVNNSYIQALASGICISTLPHLDLSKGRDLPLTLTTPIALIVNKSLSFLSKSIQTNRQNIDKHIAELAVPSACIGRAAYHALNPKSSSIWDVAMAITLLITLDDKVIQPAIRFIAPAQTSYNVLSFLQEVPIIQRYPMVLKLLTVHSLSSFAEKTLSDNFSKETCLELYGKFLLATGLTFVSINLYPLLRSMNIFSNKPTNSPTPLSTKEVTPLAPPSSDVNTKLAIEDDSYDPEVERFNATGDIIIGYNKTPPGPIQPTLTSAFEKTASHLPDDSTA